MKSYRIDAGNSSTGPVGFVAYVKGRSRKDALARLMEFVPRDGQRILKLPDMEVIVYLNLSQVRLGEVERE